MTGSSCLVRLLFSPLSASLCSTPSFPLHLPSSTPSHFVCSPLLSPPPPLLIPFILSLSSRSTSQKSLVFWSDHGGWCQRASLRPHMICARASRYPCAGLECCWLRWCKWCKEETNQKSREEKKYIINHASAPLWSRISVTKRHTPKHTHAPTVEVIFRYSRVQSLCFPSLGRLWLVVQQASRQRISPWG